MNEAELKAKLAVLDEEIKVARLAAENAKADLELVVMKRRNFASINCDHPHAQRYRRSCMGEVDVYCGVCDTCL